MTCAQPVGIGAAHARGLSDTARRRGNVAHIAAHDARRPSSMDRGFPSIAVHDCRRSRLHDVVVFCRYVAKRGTAVQFRYPRSRTCGLLDHDALTVLNQL